MDYVLATQPIVSWLARAMVEKAKMETLPVSFCTTRRSNTLLLVHCTRYPVFGMASADVSQMTPPETQLWSKLLESGNDSETTTDEEADDSSPAVKPVRSSPYRRADRHVQLLRHAKMSSGPRKKLREFLGDLLDAGEVEGLRWISKPKQTFRVPWRHANKRGNGYDEKRDTHLTRLWALNTQKFDPNKEAPDPSRWKTNFRCALNSLRHSIVEVENCESNGYKVYRFDDARRGRGRSLNATNPPSPERAAKAKVPEVPAQPSQTELSAPSPSICDPPSVRSTSTIKDLLPHSATTATRTMSSASLSIFTTDQRDHGAYPHYPTPAPSDCFAMLDDVTDSSVPCWSAGTMGGSRGSTSDLSISGDFLDDLHPNIEPRPPTSGLTTSCEPSAYHNWHVGGTQGPSQAKTAADFMTFCTDNQSVLPDPVPIASTTHEMYVSVNYRHTAVAGKLVSLPHGCRVYAGVDPHQQVLSHDEFRRLYGNCKMEQMSLPMPSNVQACSPSLKTLLEHLLRGVCFEMEDDHIYATRLCQPQVFWGTIQSCNEASLARGKRTQIFNYKTFESVLKQYQENPSSSYAIASQPPVHTVQLCVGQPWGGNTGRLAANNLITISVTHTKAERLMERLHVQRWESQRPLNSDQLVIDEMTEEDLFVQRFVAAHQPIDSNNSNL